MKPKMTHEKMIETWEWEKQHSNSPLWEAAASIILYALTHYHNNYARAYLALQRNQCREMAISIWYERAIRDLDIIRRREKAHMQRAWKPIKRIATL